MNTIAERIYDFLKGFPPFDMLTKKQLMSISRAVEVVYYKKGQSIFNISAPVEDYFYVVKDGAIGLYTSEKTLIDECDEGDIFGLRALLRKDNYKLEARAIEESIVYTISSQLLEDYITSNSEASQFLMTSFITNSRNLEPENANVINSQFSYLQSADYSKNPITCSIDTTIQSAAQTMSAHHIGSIIVTENSKPIGIITDKDLRTKIATGKTSISESVSKIMSSPVITYPENTSVAEAQIAMLKHQITHLCITKDGTVNSELTGVLSEHDIIVLRENNASSLVKEITRCQSEQQLKAIRTRAEDLLKRYLQQEAPIEFVAKLIATINDAITKRIIDLILKTQDKKPPTQFAWLAIGSQGRQEQLLMTDQDNALVYEDVDKDKNDKTKSYFLNLAKQINNALAEVGFELCPANMMGSNSQWCLSVSEWSKQFNRWIISPDQDNLMLCTIFFDFELVYGSKDLVDRLSQSIFESIKKHDIFLTYLGRNALQNPPPLSFFRQFLVESDGEHKNQFDIKARSMMPLVDAARLLILSHKIKSVNNTIERFKKLVELEPQNKDTYLFCIEAYKDLLWFRTEEGLKNADSGRFIDVQSLSKINRLKLRRSFKAVKLVQELIQTRFKLSQLL
jgi:CBS domain-containing protein